MKRREQLPAGASLPAMIALIVLAPSHLAMAEPNDHEARAPGLMERTVESARDSHRWIGCNYRRLTQSIDNYFAEDKFDDLPNESYLRLELKNTFRKEGEMEDDVRLKAKLDLPGTKRRLRLVFDSENKEDTVQQDRVRTVSSGQRVERTSSIAGLEYKTGEDPDKWQISRGAGIRLKSELIPYARLKAEKRTKLGKHWYFDFTQAFRYFEDKGFSEYTQLEFVRPISANFEYRHWNELEFRDQEDRFDFASTMMVRQRLGDNAGLEYRVGAFGNSDDRREIDSYFVGTTYSHRLYQEYIFLSLSPELFFKRENGWDTDPSFTVQMDVYFR